MAIGNAGCFLQHRTVANPLAASKSSQPDKALFDVAMADLNKGQYTVARLNLETLLNTYPDSEYLAQAKMAIANSWYDEGGIEGMAQAEAQYKDFITFFPAMKEAAEAQLRVAEIHFRQIQKPDRDPTEANRAQAELRTFLVNYPDSSLRPQALQMLRQTQEVLAEREYLIGQYYLDQAKQGDYSDYRAAQSRFEELLAKYPLYSRGDLTLDELANSYMTTSRLYSGAVQYQPTPPTKELYTANATSDREKAIQYFQRLVVRYPESGLAKDARTQLSQLHVPVPQPTAEEIAFNQQEIAGRTVDQKAAKKGLMADVQNDLNSVWSGKPTTQFERADKVGTPALSEVQWTPDTSIPGLTNLIRETMIATGAIPAGTKNSAIIAALTGGQDNPTLAGAAGPDPSTTVKANTAAAPAAPLAFQDVPTQKAQGADTAQTNTPQATTGNNNDDPNAVKAAPPAAPSVVLTPNEIDLQTREEMLASQVHREIPAPADQLAKIVKQRQEAAAKAMAKLRNQANGAKPASSTPASADPAQPPVTAPKKGFFSHIWPQ